MGTYPQEAWDRLGDLLVSRRVELDARFRNRRAFAAAVDLDYRVLYDIESARRTNYTKSTLRAAEQAYRLKSGSLDRTLEGGPLELADRAGTDDVEARPPADSEQELSSRRERIVVEIPKNASPAEAAGLQAIQAILDAQQQEIDQLAARQLQHEREMAELREQVKRDDNGHRSSRRNSA